MEQLMKAADVAEVLQVSVRTVRRLVARQKLDGRRVGRQVRVTRESVDAYLREAKIVDAAAD